MPFDLPRFFHDTRQRKWLFCAGVAFLVLALGFWPDGFLHFRYDREALAAGEIWRLLSGHLVHVNFAHLLLNLAGLFLLCELLLDDMPIRHGLGLSILAALGISAALWQWHPALLWYAGLSGILHGLWAGGALTTWRARPYVGGIALVLLLIKLMTEWLNGPSVQVTKLIGAPVVMPAHFYGAGMGMIYLLLWKLAMSWQRKN